MPVRRRIGDKRVLRYVYRKVTVQAEETMCGIAAVTI